MNPDSHLPIHAMPGVLSRILLWTWHSEELGRLTETWVSQVPKEPTLG